jgi:hypothetical protein
LLCHLKKKKSFASERQKNYLAISYFANPHASLRHSPISGFFHFFKKQLLLMKQFLTLLFFTVSIGGKILAQAGLPPTCPPGPPFGPALCSAACVYCDMNNGLDDETLAFSFFPPITFDLCPLPAPPVTISNPRWYAFIAGSSFIAFNIKATTCTSGSGLDAIITAYCPSFAGPPLPVMACATLDPANPIIAFDGFTVGNVYWLAVDGTDGAVCKFNVSVVQGSASPPDLGPVGTISGPTEVCPKAKGIYTIPTVQYATTYTWTAPASSKINGGSNVATYYVIPGQIFTGNSVEVEFGSVGGSVCVSVSSQCKDPITKCLTVTNTAIPITELPDEVHCYEELPYIWPEEPYPAVLQPGTYTLTSTPYQSYLGCDSVVRQKIKVLPFKYKILPPTFICEPNCYEINGNTYCESGSYVETLITPDGCDSTISFTVVKIPVQAAAQVTDTLTCAKTEVVLTSEGSTTGNTVLYEWFNPSGQIISYESTAIATTPGVHTLVVTNYGGGGLACKDTATVVVVAETTLPLANAGPDKVLSCAQPQVQLQGSGSVGPQFTYLWIATNGGNIVMGGATLTPTVNAPGIYILRVTDNINGCTAADVVKVTAQTLPPTASAAGGTYTCSQPTVVLQITTNATSPTFLWSGPNGYTSNQQNPSVNVAGTYTVIVTDSITGCTNSAIAIVTDNAQPPGASASGNTLTCVTTSVIINGNSPASTPTFAWSGPNGFTSNLQNPTVSIAGNYLLTVTGTNGCTSTATAVVSLNNTPPGASLSTSGNLNCNNSTVNIIASSTPPTSQLEHLWTKPDGSTTSTGPIPVLNVDQPGAYSVLITDMENGCTSTTSVTVIQNPNVTSTASATLASCNGASDGSVSVIAGGGNGSYTYQWNTGANTATVNNLGSGTYTVTVTDGENCTATATATVNQPEPIVVNASATPQTANGAADGTASANPGGGTPGYTFAWSNGGNTATITGLLPDSYTVTVTDQNGCTAVAVVTVNAYNCTIAATIQSENVSCAGAADGSATIVTSNGVAPFTYDWNTGANTASIQNLAPGSYFATVTDAANCPVELLVEITEPNPLQVNASATNASSPIANDGTATAAPTGGTSPYSYLWTTSDMTASISGLGVGTYTVTVTDANDCTSTQSVEVAANCALLSDFVVTSPTCNGLTNGEATVLITGGTSPFIYEWSSGGTAQTETNLGAGTYEVSVTDAEGCQIVDSVILTQPPLLTMQVESVTNTSCVNTPAGSATVSAQGGTGAISIAWSDGQTGPTAINLVAGDFIATATDENGCTATQSVSIDAVDTESPAIVANPTNVPLGPTGTITLTPQNLGVMVTDNCVVSSVTVEPTNFNCTQLGPHTITVSATDDSGNTSTTTMTATIIDNLPPTTSCPPSVVRCFGNNVVQYDAPVATDNCLGNGGTWELTAGLPSGASFPTGVTTNTYTYTDAGGNPGSCSFEVTILTQLTTTAVVIPDTAGQNVGAIDLIVSGSLSPYTFQWTKDGAPFATTEDLANLGVGNYVVVVTDAFGCTATSQTFMVVLNANEPDWATGLLIMPNPTSGHVAVIFPDGVNEEVQLTVFDVTGRRVIKQNITAPKQVDLDLSALPSGVYPILLRVENEMIARRIVVSK